MIAKSQNCASLTIMPVREEPRKARKQDYQKHKSTQAKYADHQSKCIRAKLFGSLVISILVFIILVFKKLLFLVFKFWCLKHQFSIL